MTLHKTLILSTALLISPMAMAGGGHAHGPGGSHSHHHAPASQQDVENRAAQKVAQLTQAGKIAPTWKGAKAQQSEKKQFGNQLEWVVRFHNANLTGSGKENLFVFYSLDGHYIAANYSGK